MNDLSIVIPWRSTDDAHRDRICDWIIKRYERLLPKTTLHLADSDEFYPFNRGEARNHGMNYVRTKYVLIADADTICDIRFINAGISVLENNPDTWVLPYDRNGYYNLTEKFTERILSMWPVALLPRRDELEFEHELESWSGLILMKTESFEKTGGYDPSFQGWGYEDNAFALAADTLIGEHQRISGGYCMHLWHPAPEETRFKSPYIHFNQKRYKEYQLAYGNVQYMSNLKGLH